MAAQPLKVLDLRDTHEVGGPGKTILETSRAIDRERFSVHLGVFRDERDRADTPFLDAARQAGMPVHEIRGRSAYDPKLIWRLAALVREQRFDLVHAHEASSDVITCAMRLVRRVPIVTTAHGWISNSAKGRFMVALDKHMMRYYDCVIAVSSRIERDLLEAGVPQERIYLLHNAIVLENYRRRDDARGNLDAIVGRALPRPVMVSIGRLSAEKGHADLIEALRLLAGKGRFISTVLAGDGPARADIERRIREGGLQDWVHLPGYVSQPARLLQDADLMVLPSHTEGLPNAALEAFAMEVPVLATSVGGTPEVVTDGETGRLVPARSPESLANAISDYLDNPSTWKHWAGRGRTVVEQRFDFKTRTRKLEALYTEIVNRH
jgi:glycosyltransferase involved in cell wall biosynthesis